LHLKDDAKIFGGVNGTEVPFKNFRRLKSALSFSVINYGLKPVACFAFAIRATDFSQWLMTSFLSAEFIRRLFGRANLT
jgi:hypothetical protein